MAVPGASIIRRFLPSTWEQRLFLILVLLYLLPIWVVTYFPSQDGPSHVYNAFILKEYNNSAYPQFQEYYDLNLIPFPNWLSHAVLRVLMQVFPPLIAEKILVSGYAILFLLGGWFLLSAVDPKKRWLAFLLFPFVYNYLLHMGFYNFCYSLAFFFLSIGYWWKHRYHLTPSHALTLNLLLVLCYFSHLVSTVLALLTIAVLWLSHLRRRRLQRYLLQIPMLLPATILPIWYIWSHGTAAVQGGWTLEALRKYLLNLEVLISFSDTQRWIGIAVVVLFGVFCVLTLIRDKLAWHDGKPRFQVARTDILPLLCVGFVLLYWYVPDGLSGGGFMKHRLSLYPFLILLPWFTTRLNRKIQWAGIALLTFLALANLGYLFYWYPRLDADMHEFRAGLEAMPTGGTVLPLAFDRNGQCQRIGMFLHAIGYYCAYTGAVEWDNYEATTDYFPVRYKPGLNRPDTGVIEGAPQNVPIEGYLDLVDTIHTWAMPLDAPIAQKIEEHYDLIFSQGRTRIYRRAP